MAENLKVSIKNLDVHYGDKQALFNVNLNIMEKEVTSLIGTIRLREVYIIKMYQ